MQTARFAFIASFALSIACLSQASAQTGLWDKQAHNFGSISQGKPARAEFKFKNTGKTPAVISDVKPSCACVTASFSKTPVTAGGTGVVTLTYDAKAAGPFNKTATVTIGGSPTTTVLTVKGAVK